MEKQGVPKKHLFLLYYAKALTVWIITNYGNFFKRWVYQITSLPPEKSVCESKATVRTRHVITDWFKIGKGVQQGCILSPCLLFNLYAEYLIWNGGLDEPQAGIKIDRRHINNLRYADDTTLMAESEELKSHLMKVKEESEKVGLELNIQKMKIMASGAITSWQIEEEKWKQ